MNVAIEILQSEHGAVPWIIVVRAETLYGWMENF